MSSEYAKISKMLSIIAKGEYQVIAESRLLHDTFVDCRTIGRRNGETAESTIIMTIRRTIYTTVLHRTSCELSSHMIILYQTIEQAFTRNTSFCCFPIGILIH